MFLMYYMHAKTVNCGHLCMACDMHVQIIWPDVLGFPNFTTLVKNYKLGFYDYNNPKLVRLVISGPIVASLSLLGPKLFLGLNCNFLQFWPFSPVQIQSENNFLGPNFNIWFLKVQNNFGPILDFGLNHIEAQLPVENPNN